MNPRTRLRVAAFAVALMAGLHVSVAGAQWAWKDDTGRMVYSNLPPPANVKASRIVRQPTAAATPADAEPGKPAAAPPAAGATKTWAERDAEFRKRQQERADGERKAQDEEQKAAQKAADCQRSRGYLKALEDGVRVTRTDAAGNREFLDDAQRATEAERMRKAVADFCN
jgi:hypothetical protein